MVVGDVPMMALQPLNLGTEMCSVPFFLPSTPPPFIQPYSPYLNSSTPPSPLTPPSPASPSYFQAVTYVPTSNIPYHHIPVTIMNLKPDFPRSSLQSPEITQCLSKNFIQCTPGLCCVGPKHTTFPAISNVVYPWKQLYGMEQVWRNEFFQWFQIYTKTKGDLWTLIPVNDRPDGGMFYEDVDSAKVRFCCETCGHGWTSMKGRVAFWYFLNYATNEGIVCLKLYGQQCDRCKRGVYEQPMWYPEEVTKVMINIYNKVGMTYYGFNQAIYYKTRRSGKPRTPHNNNLCQACKDGLCAERR